MKFHGITMAGPFVSQKLTALPPFNTVSDPGRIVWLTDGTIWYGSDTDWRGFAASDFESAKEEDFYSDLLRTTIFLNASWDGFIDLNMVSSTDMAYDSKSNRLDYTNGQTLLSKNLYDPRSNLTKIRYLMPYVEYVNTTAGIPSLEISSNGGVNWTTIQNGRIMRVADEHAGIDIRLRFTAVGSGSLYSWGVLYNKDLSAACSKYGLTYSRFVAVEDESIFALDYVPSAIQVFLNGDLLDETDYEATNGEFIVFNDRLNEGDIVYVVTFSTSTINSNSDYILRTGSVAFTGNQSMGGYKLNNLSDGVLDTDAANIGQVYSIVDNVTDDFIRTDGSVPFESNQSMGGYRLTNLVEGVNPNDAVNLSQIASIVGGTVITVAGRSGHVTLTKDDVGLSQVDNTSDVNKPISTATQTALNLKANLASPALTGVPTAPTAPSGTDSNQIATTAFVKSQGYVSTSGVVDIFVDLPMVSSGGITPTLSILEATQSSSGLMSAADKTSLDNMILGTGTVTNISTTDGISGGPITTTGTLRLTGQALSYHNLSVNGLVTRTAVGSILARSIMSGDGIAVSNGNGIAGNPVITNTDRGSHQNIFKSIVSPGQPTITAPLNESTLIVNPGSGISILLDNSTNTMHISNTDAGSGQSIFKNVMVDGFPTLTATNNNDYITFVAAGGIEVGTGSVDNSITISNTDRGKDQNIFKRINVAYDGGGGSEIFATLNDDTLKFAAGRNIDLYVDNLDNSILITGKDAIIWNGVIADSTAVANTGYFVDTTTGPTTITLPDTPLTGDTIIVNDVVGNFSINNCIIDGNGNNINSLASNITLNTNDKTITLVYFNSVVGWKVINEYN